MLQKRYGKNKDDKDWFRLFATCAVKLDAMQMQSSTAEREYLYSVVYTVSQYDTEPSILQSFKWVYSSMWTKRILYIYSRIFTRSVKNRNKWRFPKHYLKSKNWTSINSVQCSMRRASGQSTPMEFPPAGRNELWMEGLMSPTHTLDGYS